MCRAQSRTSQRGIHGKTYRASRTETRPTAPRRHAVRGLKLLCTKPRSGEARTVPHRTDLWSHTAKKAEPKNRDRQRHLHRSHPSSAERESRPPYLSSEAAAAPPSHDDHHRDHAAASRRPSLTRRRRASRALLTPPSRRRSRRARPRSAARRPPGGALRRLSLSVRGLPPRGRTDGPGLQRAGRREGGPAPPWRSWRPRRRKGCCGTTWPTTRPGGRRGGWRRATRPP